MPFQIGWYVDRRIIEIRGTGEITTEEFHRANKQLADYIQSGIPPLFLLVDLREVTRFPLDFKGMLAGIRDESAAQTVNFQWTVFLSNNKLLNFFSALASNVANVSSRVFKTQDEADQFFARQAPDLAPLIATRLLDPSVTLR